MVGLAVRNHRAVLARYLDNIPPHNHHFPAPGNMDHRSYYAHRIGNYRSRRRRSYRTLGRSILLAPDQGIGCLVGEGDDEVQEVQGAVRAEEVVADEGMTSSRAP